MAFSGARSRSRFTRKVRPNTGIIRESAGKTVLVQVMNDSFHHTAIWHIKVNTVMWL